MSLQPTNAKSVDRTTVAPFLLNLFYSPRSPLTSDDFSIAPPADTTDIPDYTALLPPSIRQNSVQVYTWPTCTLSELTGLLTSAIPEGILPEPSAGSRLVYKLIFPDTRGVVSESGRGRWQERPLGSVVIGEQYINDRHNEDEDMVNGDHNAATPPPPPELNLTGDAEKTLADARFVIGDYVACTIYPPTADGRVAPLPPASAMGRCPRDPYMAPRGPPPGVNGYGGGSRGGYRGSYGRGNGPPPMGDWRRGERPPGFGGGYGGGGYRGGRGGRPY